MQEQYFAYKNNFTFFWYIKNNLPLANKSELQLCSSSRNRGYSKAMAFEIKENLFRHKLMAITISKLGPVNLSSLSLFYWWKIKFDVFCLRKSGEQFIRFVDNWHYGKWSFVFRRKWPLNLSIQFSSESLSSYKLIWEEEQHFFKRTKW